MATYTQHIFNKTLGFATISSITNNWDFTVISNNIKMNRVQFIFYLLHLLLLLSLLN